MGLLGSIEVLMFPSNLMDSIMSWNVRGLNDYTRQFEVKSLLKNHKVSMAGLLETKVRECNFSRFIKFFAGWEHVYNYDVCSFGRLLVIWNKAVISVTCLYRRNQMVHCYVTFIEARTSCYVTFIYAMNDPVDRTPFWADLMRIGQGINAPWLILGDFNTTLFSNEREREGEVVPGNTSELENFTQQRGLADLRYNGIRLTWSDKRVRRLFCKLDRALINSHWMAKFEDSDTMCGESFEESM